MIDKTQLQDLYNQGTISFNAAQLNNVPIANTVKSFLTENGLPESSRKESTLGVHFVTDASQITAVSAGNENYWKIGDEWEENTNIIAIKEGTEEVYEVELNSGKATFINSNLPSFLLLLQYFKQYAKRKEASEPPPMQLSREEMLKKLEMMRNGTLPVAAPKKEKFDQKKESKAMKGFMQQTDAIAIKNEDHWWSMILEQVEDDIL